MEKDYYRTIRRTTSELHRQESTKFSIKFRYDLYCQGIVMGISGMIGWGNMMYNPDLKEDFLSMYKENTRKSTRYVFSHSYYLEDKYQKDLKDFAKNELDELLIRLTKKTTSMNNFNRYFSVIKKYIQWAIDNGYKKSGSNLMSDFNKKDYQVYIDKSKFISEQKLIEIEEILKNYQDKVVLRLIFEGVNGENVSELVNLKIQDVDSKNKKLRLCDDKGRERFIQVSDRCLSLIKKAHAEKIYYPRNGNKQSKRGKNKLELMQTDHIIKNTLNGKIQNPVSKDTIYRRIGIIKEILEFPDLTVKNIRDSGMIKMAVDLYKRDGELTTTHLEEIAEHFGFNTSVNNGIKGYNTDYLETFINPEIILNLYEIDIRSIRKTERTKIEKLDQKKNKSIKKLSIDERAKVIYEFLCNGTIDEETRSVIEFYGIHDNQKAQFPDVTPEKIIEVLKEFNEKELEELNSENEEQFEKIYHVIMNENDGKDVFRTIKTRVGQYKLRKILLQNYQSKCAMCDISHRKLLVTSHIKPWADSSPEERIDPRNAILLCKLHDALFENGFISLSDEYEVIFSKHFDFAEQGIQTNIRFKKPLKDAPSPVFLKEHRQKHGL
jgi:integrase